MQLTFAERWDFFWTLLSLFLGVMRGRIPFQYAKIGVETLRNRGEIVEPGRVLSDLSKIERSIKLSESTPLRVSHRFQERLAILATRLDNGFTIHDCLIRGGAIYLEAVRMHLDEGYTLEMVHPSRERVIQILLL